MAELFAGNRVSDLELKPGGQVCYRMTATAPEQVAFLEDLGLPLTNEFRRTFTEIAAPTRLAYLSVIDFVPGQEPYEHLTTVDFQPRGDGSQLIMTIDPLHDEGWTREAIQLPSSGAEGSPPASLKLPPNLHIIGTVNLDE